jgi:hypothetical protein
MNIFQKIYEQVLLEAIWDVNLDFDSPDNDPFRYYLQAMYELEYKLAQLRKGDIKGNPRRLENMIRNVEVNLKYATKYIKNIMEQTLAKWLESHAILNPNQWATARVKDLPEGITDEEMFDYMMSEYARYAPAHMRQQPMGYQSPTYRTNSGDRTFTYMINEIEKHINDFPEFKAFIELTYLTSEQDYRREQYEENPEEYKQTYGFKTDEEAEQSIDNLTVDDLPISDIIPDQKSFVDALVINGYFINVLTEMYEKLVFPLWYHKWSAEGIDETRENAEKVYNDLTTANENNLGELITRTNIALNTAHQNGSMLDYTEQLTGEDQLKGLLNSLTEGDDIDKWNNQLREVGINPK